MRLLTRSDFDGLICAVLLSEIGIIDNYKFVHPKDIQDGKIEVSKDDVLANIPYSEGCGLWFDHHSSEALRLELDNKFKYEGKSEEAPSCARVIYNYYKDEKFEKYESSGLMEAVDKTDSGNLSAEDITDPKGWILLSYIMDPRTGLGRYNDYRISNYEMMMDMIEYCKTKSPEEILEIPDVKERVIRYFDQEKEYEQMIKDNSVVDGNVLIIDLHNEDPIKSGNRFKEYVLFPEQNISVRILWGFRQQNMVMTCGHSILNRTSKTNVGELMLKYGGGGHRAVGTCQVEVENWEKVKDKIVKKMKEDG